MLEVGGEGPRYRTILMISLDVSSRKVEVLLKRKGGIVEGLYNILLLVLL